MRIHLYCLCWNEAKLIPYFLRHYASLADALFIYDNGSTDGSQDLLRADPRVTVTHFDRHGESFVAQERALSDSIWRKSRDHADWVIIIDMDEHLYHQDLRGYLARCSAERVTAIRSIGYEMVADSFPTESASLNSLVTSGTRSLGHDKLCAFNPNAISRTNFGLGRHSAAPQGMVVWPEIPDVTMLHYKYLGLDYVLERNEILRRGLGPRDLRMGWGAHYLRKPEEVAADFNRMRSLAGPVPGLSGSENPAAHRRVEQMLRRSGLFQPAYYLAMNPDVSQAGVDPLTHYHVFGWREGRRPNPYFDPAWYKSTYASEIDDASDPLVDYLMAGESAGRKPCRSFDPVEYRRALGISETESPLRHFLQRLTQGNGRKPVIAALAPREANPAPRP